MINEVKTALTTCSCACEKVSIDEQIEQLRTIVQSQKGVQGSLIPMLQTTQNLFGYLPDGALRMISNELDISYSEVAGVVDFYSYFSTTPKAPGCCKHSLPDEAHEYQACASRFPRQGDCLR